MKRRLLLALSGAGLLSSCVGPPVTAIHSGETRVKGRLVVDVATPWNQFELGSFAQTPTWTNEGITLDALQFWVGVKDGDLLAPTPSEPKGMKPLAFKSGMQAAEVVALYQSLWTRDGSSFTLVRLEPTPFLEGNGFRLEYTRLRKVDEVLLQGVAWGAVRAGELFVIAYSAPRLAFYARYLPRVEAIVKSARVRG